MPAPAAPDHDQRLKVLLKEFFEQFLRCFFPDWAVRFDFAEVTWLDKEVFLAPPQGEKRQLDLVARLRLRPDTPPPQEGLTELLTLVHVEIESRESALALRPRMFEYYVQLRRDHGLPVFPVGLLLRVGLQGVGWDAYEEFFWERRLLRFEYAYVGLPGLEAEKYVSGENLLGTALSVLMKVPPQRRAELQAEALKRIVLSSENEWRRYLLAECVEAYGQLDEGQKERLRAMLATEPYQSVRSFMITTYERGIQQGILEGIQEGRQQGLQQGLQQGILQGERASALRLLEAKFGPLSPAVLQRVEALPPDQLRQLQIDLLNAQTLKDLRLEDENPAVPDAEEDGR